METEKSLNISYLGVLIYQLIAIGTFIFLTFFDKYEYNAFNWIVVVPINAFLSEIWPIYWLMLRWI